MATVTAALLEEQRFRISALDWRAYVGIGACLLDRPIRLTYDRGELEFMTLSPEQERSKHLLGLLLLVIAEELDIDIAGYGSMTCRREDADRGLEPDECY